MAKRKKGSKTVPKGKAPLGELPLPYEVPVGKLHLTGGCRGGFRPRQQLQHDSYRIDREIAHMTAPVRRTRSRRARRQCRRQQPRARSLKLCMPGRFAAP